MMSRLCLLAALLCLPLGCFGLLEQCMDELESLGLPQEGVNNYKAYSFTSEMTGDCDDLTETCFATIARNATLIGRTWFITNIKPNYGFGYENNIIQEFRVQCPRGTLLHLFVQQSDLPQPGVGGSCDGVDYVRIQAAGLGTNDEVTFCGDNDDVQAIEEIYNFGLGRIIPDGQASISFCSNNIDESTDALAGFVIRATCLNPGEIQLPGCTDLMSTLQKKPEFANLINRPLAEADKVALLHRKRRTVSEISATWASESMHREKKFVDSIELTNEEIVTYSEGNVTVIFANGTGETRIIPRIFCFITYTSLVGTRWFYFSSPFEFFGPGKLEITGSIATLTYTIAPDNFERFFLPGPLEMNAANAIYNYMYENYIFPYPVIDPMERRDNALPIFPLPSGHDPPKFPGFGNEYKPVYSLGFVQEDIQMERGQCIRAILTTVAPSLNARLPQELISFCAFFAHSCDLTLRVACQELNRLEPSSVGK